MAPATETARIDDEEESLYTGLKRVVGVASSAGGVSALGKLVSSLPGAFPAPIIVVQHLDPHHKSQLAEILGRQTALLVSTAVNEGRAMAGHVYVAPPDRHVTVNQRGHLSLDSDPQVHFVRPSADVLFASLAVQYGKRAIVVVLTGTGGDGATGAALIKKAGGTVLVEDPATATFPGMPAAALAACKPDYVLEIGEMGAKLCELVDAA